jgi:aspartate dehydrogenase
MRALRVGIIGCGTLGAGLSIGIHQGQAGPARLQAVLATSRSIDRAVGLCQGGALATTDPEEFLRQPLDLVVEAAGKSVVREYGENVLERGADLMICSVAALAEDDVRERLIRAAAAGGRRIFVPSGAILGLDGLQAASLGRMDEVVHITRKPPAAWKGTLAERQVDLEALQEPVVLYEGSPVESARLYPANVNVQTAVSLAGIGLHRTRVVVVVDPTITQNEHEVIARGEFGEFHIILRNNPTENPKTGIITPLSLIKAVRNLTAPLVIGV